MGTWVLDLDGVVWWGDALLPGADRAIRTLFDHGHLVVACTNHALSPAGLQMRKSVSGCEADRGSSAREEPAINAADPAASMVMASRRVIMMRQG